MTTFTGEYDLFVILIGKERNMKETRETVKKENETMREKEKRRKKRGERLQGNKERGRETKLFLIVISSPTT